MDAAAMLGAADLVVDVVEAAVNTGRTVSFAASRVTVKDDGTEIPELYEVAVYEVVVSGVRKGVTVQPGDRVLIAPSVDMDAVPPASQTGTLETAHEITLYLIPTAVHGVWTTLSPFQGVEAARG